MKRRNLLTSLGTLAAGALAGVPAVEGNEPKQVEARLVHFVGIDRAEVAAHLTAEMAGKATLCYERRPAQGQTHARVEFWETVDGSAYQPRFLGDTPTAGTWHWPVDPDTGHTCPCARAYADRFYGRKKKPPVLFRAEVEGEQPAIIQTTIDGQGTGVAQFPVFRGRPNLENPNVPAEVMTAEEYQKRRERLQEAWRVIEREGREA